MFYVSIVFHNIALLAIKLSFLCQYCRIMAVPRMRRTYALALLVVGAWSASKDFIAAFQCLPVEGFWDKSVKSHCISNQPQRYVNAAGNVITDVAVFALPFNQTDTWPGTHPTRPNSSLPKSFPRDAENETTASGVSSERLTRLKDERSITHGSPYQHHTNANESSETIFSLASVRVDSITPVKSSFSPLSPRPVRTASSSTKSYSVRRDGTSF
ncbi:hypothetical protein CORC01_11218 [Colletotrichum orchidophilum]|uniref:Rhodopsin domain-containing protein n=1 Tax=Colletotrichum orchidophilum TaxID=1209926 RepID=A0A1G4AWH4_9PEZI|nr:uncharacterized protein CORC01_11218 [Colletotrichum orchidophilum]OHE93443.1 hypothetical protein CORC01_11218 [Colletotrichum orchidophilum]